MSIAQYQFPPFVWRDGKKRLWNSIHRKSLKNRPEERVRLQVVEFLLAGGWSPHRISTEEALDLPQKEALLRTDLICYNKQFEPLLLIECKAGQIKINQQTAHQIAGYNRYVLAPYLLMTNGLNDYWYRLNKEQAEGPLDGIPDSLSIEPKREDKSFAYWAKRGFAGKQAASSLRRWLTTALNTGWMQKDAAPARFLTFNNSPGSLSLNHYYQIESFSDNRLAITFVNTPFGDSRLIGILNKTNKNIGMVEINLDLLFEDCTPNTTIYSAGKARNIDFSKQTGWKKQAFEVRSFAQRLYHLFEGALQ